MAFPHINLKQYRFFLNNFEKSSMLFLLLNSSFFNSAFSIVYVM